MTFAENGEVLMIEDAGDDGDEDGNESGGEIEVENDDEAIRKLMVDTNRKSNENCSQGSEKR